MSAPTQTELPPFTREQAIRMLRLGEASPDSPFTHRQIARWCERFWCSYIDVDVSPEFELLLSVLEDVDCQWDLFLANTYPFEELRTMDLDLVSMPALWFSEWLRKLGV